MLNKRLRPIGDGDDPGRAVGKTDTRLAHREFGGKLLNARSPNAPRQQDGVGRARHHGVEIGVGLARIERICPDEKRRAAAPPARLFKEPLRHGARPCPFGWRRASKVDDDGVRPALERLGEPFLFRRRDEERTHGRSGGQHLGSEPAHKCSASALGDQHAVLLERTVPELDQPRVGARLGGARGR